MAANAGFPSWREASMSSDVGIELAHYEAKTFSVLHLISEAAFEAGLSRLKAELERGALRGTIRCSMLWATK